MDDRNDDAELRDPREYPPHGQLADPDDELEWSTDYLGRHSDARMRDYAAEDNAVKVRRAPREA